MPEAQHSRPPICGTSAFAFQGTNAHVIMQQASVVPTTALTAAAAALGQNAAVWMKQRHWVAAPQPIMIGACRSVTSSACGRGGMVVVLEADLGSVRAGFLRHFRAGHQAVVPLAGLVGLCQDALGLLTSSCDMSGNAYQQSRGLNSSLNMITILWQGFCIASCLHATCLQCKEVSTQIQCCYKVRSDEVFLTYVCRNGHRRCSYARCFGLESPCSR